MTRREGVRRKTRVFCWTAVWLASVSAASGVDDTDVAADADDGSFGMSTPVACKEVRGFADYEPLAPAELTSDEKLLVYYEPRHFKSTRAGEKYEAHFLQEGRIRRRNAKSVIWSKPKLLDYTATAAYPPRQVYLRNTVSLKGLKPGDYDFDIVLRDAVGRSAAATRTLPFKIVEPTQRAQASSN